MGFSLAHDETGFGYAAHKRLKNEFAAQGVWDSIKDVPTCGVLRRDEVNKVVEIGWPVGLKLSQTPGRLMLGVTIAVVGMAASGALLWLAQRDIPIGTAYAVWTGIGAAGTFAVGILFYGDSASAGRLVSVGLIIASIVGLKLAHGAG